jgi:hypothetical protein
MFRASKNYTCEFCGTVQGTLRISKAGNSYRSRVVAAHRYPNDTVNPCPELLCLCERCHFWYDARFRDIVEEGRHQAVLHGILVERYLEQAEKGVSMDQGDWPDGGEDMERVCCSCGVSDDSVECCDSCGRPVHYREPECGAWLFRCQHGVGEENEFWCIECWANSLPLD